MDEDRDAYLARVLIGGREPAAIRVVEYDEQWPARFATAAGLVRRALGEQAISVEHIGSTAVPGLAAKPIIDVLLTVEDVTDEVAYVPPLEAAGFELRVREPAHRMLRTPARDVHLHVYEPHRAEVRDHRALRERLRIDAGDRELYATTKRRLARQHWADMNEYADAKAAVVHAILARARRVPGERRGG